MKNNILLSLLGKNYHELPLRNFLGSFRQKIVLAPNIDKHRGGFDIVFEKSGISFFLDKNYFLGTIHLFSEGYEGYKEYSGEMPFNVKFHMSELEIINLIGPPNIGGGGGESPLGGEVPYWIRYDFDSYSLHFSFTSPQKSSIDLITLMTSEQVP